MSIANEAYFNDIDVEYYLTDINERAISTPLYNASQVHLLPSYPKQNGSDVWVAFYIQNSGSNVTTPAIPVLVLVKIVQDGKIEIQIAIGNRTIARVQRVFGQVSTTAKPPPPTVPPSETWKWIVIGVCCGVFVLIVIIIILVLCYRFEIT
ncbi:hypothetical protein QZH41_004153 [Actinostola sp. cb2023]|nr:hypothetical protein QZH41_004153 [Actinostola sp. cb2023]